MMELTKQERQQLVQLLNRVQTQGIQEARVLLNLVGKLSQEEPVQELAEEDE